MKTVNVGLIGLGTIGRGVYDAIVSNGQLIAARTGVSLVVKGICDADEKALKDIDCAEDIIKTDSAQTLIDNESIEIIVELIGGVTPAREIILSALRNRKHIVTANKALLSGHWKEIFDEASRNGVFVNYEASVGGAIPIIRTLRMSFVGDNIKTVYGILNGTTNFILSEMSENNCTFGEALKVAQDKGLAESNPELDVSGKDSAHKLALLSLLGFGMNVSSDDIYTEGIVDIGPEDLRNAAGWGYSVKLLAIAKNTSEGLQLRVHPTLLRKSHFLSNVRGEDNAIFVRGDLSGESLLLGKGAGRKPTSSSVIGDIVEIARHVAFVGDDKFLPYNLDYVSGEKGVSRIENLNISYYLRFSVTDRPGVLAGIANILARNDISIASVAQDERNEGETVPVIIMTHKAREGSMRKAIAEIDTQKFVTDKTIVIRIEE